MESSQRKKKIKDLVWDLLEAMGESRDNEDLADTPRRFSEAMMEFRADKVEPRFTVFNCEANYGSVASVVSVSGIEVRSLCAHHLFPFTGTATIVYAPKFKKAGLSKFQRLMDYLATRPRDQETITKEYLSYLVEKLDPRAAAVRMVCNHTCMSARGVKCHSSETTTLEYYKNTETTSEEMGRLLDTLKYLK